MANSTTTIDILDIIAKIAGIITLIVAIVTYWFNWSSKQKLIKKSRIYLNIEIRTLYFNSIMPNIIKYDQLVENNYDGDMSFLSTDSPIITNIAKSDLIFKVFKKSDSVDILNMLHELIKKANTYYSDYVNHAPKNASTRKIFLDFYFKNRVVEIRDLLIELSNNEDFIDLNVMPKIFEGHLPNIDRLDSHIILKLERDIVFQNLLNGQIFDKTEKLITKYRHIQNQNTQSYKILKKYLGDKLFRRIPEQYFGD